MVGSGRLGILLAVPIAFLLSCGGRSERRTSDADAGDGGSSGSGSSGSSSGGASAGCTGCACEYGGRVYPNGASFRDERDCNECLCFDGLVSCTDIACPFGCTVDGRTYEHGESFTFDEPAGCGTCTCDDGSLHCATMPCPGRARCELLESWYSERLASSGKTCDPAVGVPYCNLVLVTSLRCGCLTFVNNDADLLAWWMEWENLGCGVGIDCEPCPGSPVGSYCSEQGMCMDFN